MSEKLNIVTLNKATLVENLNAVKAVLEAKIAANKEANAKATDGAVTLSMTGLDGTNIKGKAPKVELGNAVDLVNAIPSITRYTDLLALSVDETFVVSRTEAEGISRLLKLGELEPTKADYEIAVTVQRCR